MRPATLLLVLALASFAVATAHELPLQPGQMVRATVPSRHLDMHQDTFQQVRGDTLVLDAMWLPLSDVTQLKVYQGRKSATGWGGLVGLLGGALMGAVIGYSMGDDPPGIMSFTAEAKAGILAAVFGGVGGLGGLVIGSLIRSDTWETVPLDRPRVSVLPRRDGFSLGASIAF